MRYGEEPHHLIGTTLHNIGVLQLWQGKYKKAWENFNQAVSVRMGSLSHNHPDIAVCDLLLFAPTFAVTTISTLTLSSTVGIAGKRRNCAFCSGKVERFTSCL